MVINGYEINSEIHRGPVTTVYDANHLALGRRVILKVLNTQWSEEKDLIDRFRREAKICARLDHPNIVKIFDFSASDDSIFISMEYIEGLTLEMFIQKNKIFDFSELINITSQILSGLSYAHNQGVTHRDIKPSNIMISEEGQVKITDFGLAAVSDLPGITGQDQAVGSPAYMSPEQALGKDLDQRSDLFSLGVSLYKACAKKPPFETDNIGTTIQNILTKDVENLSTISSAIPKWFSDLIDTLLAKNREDRPESAETVLNIIKVNFNSDESEQSRFRLKTPPSGNVRQYSGSLLKYLNSKIRTRFIFLVVPVILLLSYLILQQFDDIRSDRTMGQKNPTILRNTVVQDTNLSNTSDKNIEDNYDGKNNSNQLIDASPVLTNRITISSESKSDTSASIPRIEKSQVFVIARPWAAVYIDNVYHEDTPLSRPISLEPGAHFIELKNPNYKTFSKHYEFRSAQSETLYVEMKINVGFLNIRVLPWAKIYIDGQYHETSPIEDPITVAAGEHIVTLTNPNYTTIKDTIQVVSGITLDKKFNFSR